MSNPDLHTQHLSNSNILQTVTLSLRLIPSIDNLSIMRFTTTIGAILLGSSAILAMPASVERRQNTVVGTISTALDILEASVGASQTAITNAVRDVQNGVSASAAIVAAVQANAPAIVAALQDAKDAISAVTTNAAGGLTGAVQGLTDQTREELRQNLIRATNILAGIRASVNLAVTNLGPAANVLIGSEVNAINAIAQQFVQPIRAFAEAAAAAQGSASVTVQGIRNALIGLNQILSGLLGLLGLGNIL